MAKTKKEQLFELMQAVEDSDPDAPDGAWQQMLEDAVTIFNQQNGTKFDEYDMFLEYVNPLVVLPEEENKDNVE